MVASASIGVVAKPCVFHGRHTNFCWSNKNSHISQISHGTNSSKPSKTYDFPIFPWFSHDFPMIFPWFSHFSHDFPMIFPGFSWWKPTIPRCPQIRRGRWLQRLGSGSADGRPPGPAAGDAAAGGHGGSECWSHWRLGLDIYPTYIYNKKYIYTYK